MIQVHSKENAELLYELLCSLDFVDIVSSKESEANQKSSEDDFFDMAGIWEGRDVNLTTIREQAWPRQ